MYDTLYDVWHTELAMKVFHAMLCLAMLCLASYDMLLCCYAHSQGSPPWLCFGGQLDPKNIQGSFQKLTNKHNMFQNPPPDASRPPRDPLIIQDKVADWLAGAYMDHVAIHASSASCIMYHA